MNFENIKELIHLVNGSDLTFFECNLENTFVKMGKNQTEKDIFSLQEPDKKIVSASSNQIESKIMSIPAEEKSEAIEKSVDLSIGHVVKSPIVGTFYARSAPSKPDFVKKGDKVKIGDVLCIVEAMKIMNEIVSDKEGEIAEILVGNEELVEYGQPLFQII